MANDRVTAFIVDLKYTPDGGVKILEFGEKHQSDFKGFDALPESLRLESAKQLLGERLAADLQRQGKLDMREMLEQGADKITRERRPQPFLFGRNFQLDGDFFQNKSVHPLLFNAEDRQKVLPAQNIFPANLTPAQVTDISANLDRHLGEGASTEQGCVVKLTHLSAGEGVVPMAAGDLEGFLTRHFLDDKRAGILDFRRSDAEKNFEHASPTFVIQQRIQGAPVLSGGELAAEGEPNAFDPTMRMVFLGWKEDGEVKLAKAGAYWKLPEQTVAAVKGHVSRKAIVSNISDGGGAPVPDAIQDSVYGQLAGPIQRALTTLSDIRMVDWVEQRLSPDASEAENVLGMKFALTFLGNLAKQDKDKTVSILNQIMQVPERHGKKEYELEIMSGFAQELKLVDLGVFEELKGDVADLMRDQLSRRARPLIAECIADPRYATQAIKLMHIMDDKNLGAARLSSAEVGEYNTTLLAHLSRFDLPSQMMALTQLRSGQDSGRNEAMTRFLKSVRDALDADPQPDTVLLAFLVPKKMPTTVKKIMEFYDGRGEESDLLKHAIDKAMGLPDGVRGEAFEALYEIYYKKEPPEGGEPSVPKVVADFFDTHGTIREQAKRAMEGRLTQRG